MSESMENQALNNWGVSQSWTERFELMRQSGIDEMSYWAMLKCERFKALPSSDQTKVSLNYWALVFSWLYYLPRECG